MTEQGKVPSPMDTDNDHSLQEHHSAQEENPFPIRENVNNSILNGKIVKDAVFGLITLKSYIVTIIDTVEFQRLRCIWHLGATPFVYPTANHTVFEHSIGAYHLASRLVTKLKDQLFDENNNQFRITDKDVKCVEIAALCQHIGRVPFSDAWDNINLQFLTGNEINIKYRKRFPDIWEEIKRNNEKILNMLETEKLTEEDEKLIESIIIGREEPGKEILSSIVHNPVSGLDVDMWDSLARDSCNLGDVSNNYRVEIDRLIYFARAIKDNNKDNNKAKWRIAFRSTETLNIIRVFQMRHNLYKTAYQHKTVIAIEMMMRDGFKRLENREAHIVENSDSIFWSNISTIKEFSKILTRDLYRPIYEAVIYDIREDIFDKMTKYLEEKDCELENVKLRYCFFKLGNTNENPMLTLPFYSKNDINKIFYYNEDNIPLKFTVYETKIVIFSTLPREGYGINEQIIKDHLKNFFETENKNMRPDREKWIHQ